MKKHLMMPLMCLALSACATTSAPDFYRPAGGKKQIEISARHEPLKGANGKVMIYLDGELAIEKGIPLFSGNAFEAEGTWRGKRVRASVVRVANFTSTYTRITVFLDGDHAATLTI